LKIKLLIVSGKEEEDYVEPTDFILCWTTKGIKEAEEFSIWYPISPLKGNRIILRKKNINHWVV
jgi:hypothetical protein